MLFRSEKQEDIDLLTEISLQMQDEMAYWFMEQQYQEEKMKMKMKKEQKNIERETLNRIENEKRVKQYFLDEKERKMRSEKRDKKLFRKCAQ